MKENISSIIKEIISENNFLEDWLYNGYINITGLALHIMPTLKTRLDKKSISLDSVKMAISRASKKIKVPQKEKPFDPQSIFIKRWINILFLENTSEISKQLNKLKKTNLKYLTKIHWNTEIVVTFEDYYKKEIEDLFQKSQRKEYKEDLALIGMGLSWRDMDNYPGVFYRISKWLYFHWIELTQTIQNSREFSVVVQRENLRKTFDIICSI